jgi:MoxR-like ATPase
VLLVGQPGIGKTYFANALAQTLGLPDAMFISLAGETNGSALGGSSTFWSNSSPGKLFETLAWGHNQTKPPANPLVILDEIDKISVGHYNPLAALYSLLEEDTAKVFKDQSLSDLTIDTRFVRYVCTANTVTLIPEPLLTRMVVFHIDPPSTEQLRGVIQNIYEGLISRLQTPMRNTLPEEVVQAALMLNPREAKIRLECAIASAISEDRDCVKLSDWPDIPSANSQITRRSIGFTA